MAYTRLKNNINAINYAISKNRISLPTTIKGDTDSVVSMLAEDLSNFACLGVAVSSMDADTLKSFAKDVVTGIARNIFITKAYTANTHGIAKNVEEYNGAIQRIAIKDLPDVQESHARNLVNGVNYFDGKFYGVNLSSLIFSDTFDFKLPYSIGYEDVRAKFNDMEWVDKTIASIEVAVRNSLEIKLKGIADTLVNKAIVEAIKDGREVKTVTKFCEYFGYQTEDETTGDLENDYTWSDIKASETLMKQYTGFMSMAFGLVIQSMGEMSSKYNDGSIVNFVPRENVKMLVNTEYSKVVNNLGYANIFHDNLITREQFEEVPYWQSGGQSILPLLTDTGTIKDGTFTVATSGANKGKVTAESATTYDKIIGFVYDKDMMGCCYNLDRIGVEEIGAELFVTYFHHFAISQYLDLRSNSVVFTLD